jgi:hypothetical protein
MSLVDDMLADLQRYQALVEPILEGFRAYVRVGLIDSAGGSAQQAVATYHTQLTTVEAAIAALTTLQHQQYPVVPRFTLPKADHESFVARHASILLALAQLDVG